MKYQEFEDNARRLLQHDSADVDMGSLLTSLGLPEQNQKRRALWSWISLLLALVIGASLAAYISHAPVSEEINASMETTPKVDGHTASVHTPLVTEAVNSNQKEQPEIINSTSYDKNTPLSTAVQNSTLNENNGYETALNTDASVTEKIGNVKRGSAFKPSSPEQQRQTTTHTVGTDRYDSKTKETLSATANYDMNAAVEESSLIKSTSREDYASSNTSMTGSRSTDYTVALLPMVMPALPEHDLSITLPTDKIKCPTFSKERGRIGFSIIPEVGILYTDQQLNAPTTDITAMTRVMNEQSLEGLQAGLYLKADHSKLPIYIRSGIHYSRIAHRMPLTYQRVESDTTQGVISLTTSTTGDTITAIIGDIITETTITGQSTKHYYTHQWDVPLAIGVEQAFGDWVVGVEGGVHINVRTTATGSILRTPSEFGPIENEVDISRKIGMGYFGGVQIGRQLGTFGEVYVAGRIRHVPDISAVTAGTDQSYRLYGLHAGYVYRL